MGISVEMGFVFTKIATKKQQQQQQQPDIWESNQINSQTLQIAIKPKKEHRHLVKLSFSWIVVRGYQWN